MSNCGQPDCFINDLHTHKTGTDGIIGQVCQHGSLARSCYTCELEAAVTQMQKALKSIIAHQREYDCDGECIDGLKEVARKALEEPPAVAP